MPPPLSSLKDIHLNFRNGNISRAVEVLKQVNINATKARNLIDVKGEDHVNVDAMVSSTQVS